ncbi:MAG: SDR family oxidoreductase [bacterium]|nr:SDR family oxidoreductase [bacterium]
MLRAAMEYADGSKSQPPSRGTSVLVTGATGYIGGRLIPRLVRAGHRVRVLVRDRARVDGRPWADDVEIRTGDLLQPASLPEAMEGVDAAIYLVHSMCSGSDYEDNDRRAAENFVEAGRHFRRVVYLGGLLPEGQSGSRHLRSRAEVGRILRDGLPTLELRAGPIIGSGSASFEMVRYLTERLPVVVGPTWIENKVQPIAVRDILGYLMQALKGDITGVLEVGGDPVSFREMLEQYAECRGLRRLILQARPILPPRYAAYSVSMVTRIPRTLVTALLEGIIHPVLADTTRARRLFPQISPLTYRVAVQAALDRMRARPIETHWHRAFDRGPTYRTSDREGSNRETRTVWIPASPSRVFRELERLGGERSWLTEGWGWRVLGPIDRFLGGPGLRRRRGELVPGRELGLWKVEVSEAPRLLRLRAEMRMPGEAWLQFETIAENGGTRLIQRLLFEPIGLSGVVYWYAFHPMRRVFLGSLVHSLARGNENGSW